MPAVSKKQQRFMGMCAHSNHPPDQCPDRKVAREFSYKPKSGYGSLKKRMVGPKFE